MEISKNLQNLNYVEKIVGVDIHKSKFERGNLSIYL